MTVGHEDYRKNLEPSKVQWDIIFSGLHRGGCCDLTVLCQEHTSAKRKTENKMRE